MIVLNITPEDCLRRTGLTDVNQARRLLAAGAVNLATVLRVDLGEGLPDDPCFYQEFQEALALPTLLLYQEVRQHLLAARWAVRGVASGGCPVLKLTELGRKRSLQFGPDVRDVPIHLIDPYMFKLTQDGEPPDYCAEADRDYDAGADQD
jgi:hypothetical protein